VTLQDVSLDQTLHCYHCGHHVDSTNLGSGVLCAKREIRSDLGSPVVDLLAPKPGERILDLGCGDGVLTKKLMDLGCDVVAVDSSVAQIEAARKLGLNAFTISGEDLLYNEEFDAVFSNAVLHWIKRADVMLAGVYRSLKPGGRFVC